MKRLILIGALALALGACAGDPIDAGGASLDAGPDDDPLVFDDEPEVGSLDYIHQRVIAKSCAGQPGLCHAGQFEPNLSTPANFYAYLVNRPGIEHPEQLRVKPGSAAESLLVDKLRGREVATIMPLGADPLSEEEIAMIEAWIDDGALRAPGADPAPKLNELPYPPELGVFQASTRVDGAGTANISVGQQLTLWSTVRDFETLDGDMPAVVFILSSSSGGNVVLTPGAAQDPHIGFGAYDASGPLATGDQFNWKFQWTVPATVDLRDDATGVITPDVPTAGMTLSLIGLYVDGFTSQGMSATGFKLNALRVQ